MRQLAEQLKQQAEDPFLAIARLLVATDESTLIGATEFAVRQHTLELISKAYSPHLGQIKTATEVRRSPARRADKRLRCGGERLQNGRQPTSHRIFSIAPYSHPCKHSVRINRL